MDDVGGGAGYDQYDGHGGVALPMQRAKIAERSAGQTMSRSRCGRNNQVIIAPVTRRELCIPHLLDLVYNYISGVPGLRYRHAPGGQDSNYLEAASRLQAL